MTSGLSSDGNGPERPTIEELAALKDAKSSSRSVVALQNNVHAVPKSPQSTLTQKRDFRFWMCIIAIMICSFLMIVDLAGVSTVLPVIVSDLHGRQFEWVGSAYALSATAFLPLSGGLAQVFGRRTVMLLQILLFAIGSAMCGAAPSMNVLIAGRTIQGIGAGGIASLTQIILADLVPLKERGTFNGLVALAYSFGCAASPIIGGALAQNGSWRWFFYMNLPICAVTGLLVLLFLDLKVPVGSLSERLLGLDWIGNVFVIGATTAVVLALTWGGIEFQWTSAQVLVPLVLGLVVLVGFIVYEANVPRTPLVPLRVLTSRTAISGYIQAFFANFYLLGTLFYLPVYFQGSRFASPLGSGVDIFGLSCTVTPFGMIAGISVAKSGRYRPQLWFSWVCLITAAALLTTLDADSRRSLYIGYQVIAGMGLGILITIAFFPILAPIPVSLNANALAFFMFVRFFAQVWGVTIGGAVLQNELRRRLPEEFIALFPSGTSVAYSIIPIIPSLQEPFQTQVRVAFAQSLRTYWFVLIGVAAAGLISSLFMEGLPLHTHLDEDWGLKNTETKQDGQSA